MEEGKTTVSSFDKRLWGEVGKGAGTLIIPTLALSMKGLPKNKAPAREPNSLSPATKALTRVQNNSNLSARAEQGQTPLGQGVQGLLKTESGARTLKKSSRTPSPTLNRSHSKNLKSVAGC